MRSSLRVSIQLWHGAILVAALVGFGIALEATVRRTQAQALDAELERAAREVARRLERPERPGPDHPGDRPDHSEPRPGDRPDRPGERAHERPGGRREAASELSPTLLERVGVEEAEQLFFCVWDGDGKVLRSSGPTAVAPPPAGARRAGPHDPLLFRDRDGAREAILAGPFGTRILVGRLLRREQAELAALRGVLLGVGSALLLVGLAGGFALSARLLRPVERMSAAARGVSATDLTRRVETDGVPTELAPLAETLNETFARLEKAFARQVSFTADASHELRTPLAVIHSHAELSLGRPRSPEESRATLETILRAAQRMSALVDSLLVLARADSGRLELVREPLDLADVAREATQLLETLAAGKGVTLETDLAPLVVAGDRTRLSQLVTNLVGNAIRYNREGGSVRVRLSREGARAVLAVADTGVGIAPEQQPRVFERFFRADEARTRDGGTGLGLAICRSVVEAHGGTIGFTSSPGAGSTFTASLPLGS